MPPITESVISRYFYPVGGAIIGFGMGVGMNILTRRPYMSGIQKHALGVVLGGFLGEKLQQSASKYYSDRDALLRHYVELHPEDFPPEEKKKYKDVLDPWIPIR